MTVYYLDVGQGDAAVVLCDGESMVIDGGPSSASSLMYSFLRETLALDFVDYMVSTHPHEDHIGGLSGVLNAVPVDLILSPVLEWDTKVFQSMIKYADLQGAPIVIPEEGDTLQLGGALVTILHCWPDTWTSTNDMSIVLRIDYGETSFLFTGDAEFTAEYMMEDAGVDLHADVLKVGHHGSRTSSTTSFLQAVSPRYAVISCGKDNQYEHPHDRVLEDLSKLEVDLYRTDLQGTICCTSDGRDIIIFTERQTTEDVFSSPINGDKQ